MTFQSCWCFDVAQSWGFFLLLAFFIELFFSFRFFFFFINNFCWMERIAAEFHAYKNRPQMQITFWLAKWIGCDCRTFLCCLVFAKLIYYYWCFTAKTISMLLLFLYFLRIPSKNCTNTITLTLYWKTQLRCGSIWLKWDFRWASNTTFWRPNTFNSFAENYTANTFNPQFCYPKSRWTIKICFELCQVYCGRLVMHLQFKKVIFERYL